MADEPKLSEWKRREKAAADFWSDYIYSVREGLEIRQDVPEIMHAALKDVFRKMDDAVEKAVETGYLFFRYRSAHEHPELVTLIFSNDQRKQFQRTLRIDDRFTMQGQPLHFQDYWWISIALTSVIVNEGKVRRDPRGGWIPDAIIDNADKLKTTIEADRKGMLHLKLSTDPEKR